MRLSTPRVSRLLTTLLLAVCAPLAHAFDPFVVRDIRIEGIQRTEAGTVFAYLPVKVGEQFSQEKATEAIRALFGTGFFSDVRIEVENDVVVVIVDERPAIGAIEFVGMKEFDSKTVIASLREIGFAEARIFDRALLDRAEQELKRQYLARGRYAVQVQSTVTPLERNRVSVSFSVVEGEVARIREIKILGAKAFKESELLGLFQQNTGNWLSWYTKSNQYSRQKLQADIETLRSYYLNRGYLEFSVETPQVTISADRRDIAIVITINEGERYTISEVKLAGELLGLEADLRKLITVKPGQVFSAERVNESSKAISDKLGALGYAFASVNTAPDLDRDKREAALTFFVDPNRRVYVRRVNVEGNTRTRDVVIRREMRQLESAWYDADKIQLSKERIDRLGYFRTVEIETPAVPGSPDQVDVNVRVEEKPTGMINLGVGFSSTENLIVSTGLSQDNIFGSGTNASFELNTSQTNRTLAFSHTDPYFTQDGISRSTQLYYRTLRPLDINIGDYEIKATGLGLSFGVPFTEVDRVFFGMTYEANTISTTPTSPERYQQYVNQFGRSSNALIGSIGWARDERDSAIAPTRGTYRRANAELAFAGDLRYYKLSYQHQVYWPINRMMTLAVNGQIDYGDGIGNKPYPLLKNVFAGGIGTVRGFDGGSLGPRDRITNDSLGGASRVVGNVEALFPFPGSQQDRTLRWFVFVDAGNVYDAGRPIDLSDLRYSTGLGVSWLSPIGPLKMSLGTPLNAKAGDREQRFQFQIGTGF
jgi:outer membrane protein insertion porin family